MPSPIPIGRPHFGADEETAVIEVLRSGWVSLGPKCAEFEVALSGFVGARYGRGVNSGTSALQLALLATGVEPGQDVLVPAATCAAAVHPIEAIGARPVPVDICLDDYAMDPGRIAAAITPATKAATVAHMFGMAARIEEIKAVTDQSRLRLIEDCAVGLGARIGSRHVGTYGDAATFSFHPRKTITTGEGGMVVTSAEDIAGRVATLRAYGASVSAWNRHNRRLFELPSFECVGFNYKLTDIQAAIGLVQVRRLEFIIAAAGRIASRYDQELASLGWLALPKARPGRKHAYQSYVCLCVDERRGASVRARLFEHLATLGIAAVQGIQAVTSFGYYVRRYGWRAEQFPNAVRAAECSIALPIFPDLTEEQQGRVIDAIRSFET